VLDVSMPSPTRAMVAATALVTPAAHGDLEVRVWPPEDVWHVAEGLSAAGLRWEPALPDETGVPQSLLVQRRCAADVELVLDGLGLPGLAALGYLPPDARGECRRVAGSAPQDDRMRGDVVFLELRELPYGGRWQLRGFGSPAALSTLARACAPLAVGLVEPDPTTYADRSVVLELAGRPTVVQELVEHLDAAGLDGHVRVLRVHDAVDA